MTWCGLMFLESNLLVLSRAKLGSDWRRMVQKLHPSSNKAAKCPTTPIHARETLAYLLLYISVRLLAKYLTNETCLTETFSFHWTFGVNPIQDSSLNERSFCYTRALQRLVVVLRVRSVSWKHILWVFHERLLKFQDTFQSLETHFTSFWLSFQKSASHSEMSGSKL